MIDSIHARAARHTLEALSAREAPVDIAPYNPALEDAVSWSRTRLMRCDERGLVLQQPMAGRGCVLRPGQRVQLLVVAGPQRWRPICDVLEVFKESLNTSLAVTAVRLSWPIVVHSAQRRDYYRASLAGVAPHTVTLEPLPDPMLQPLAQHQRDEAATGEGPAALAEGPGEPGGRQLGDAADPTQVPPATEPKRFKARLLNISAGGIGLEAPQRSAGMLPHFLSYNCRLDLTEFGAHLDIIATLVHLRRQDDGTHYMGLRFEFDDAQHQRTCRDVILRFTAWVERQQLHRTAQKQ